jgi:hypothetical protein
MSGDRTIIETARRHHPESVPNVVPKRQAVHAVAVARDLRSSCQQRSTDTAITSATEERAGAPSLDQPAATYLAAKVRAIR